MQKPTLPYLDSAKITVRQGQQAWHLARALEENDEVDVVAEMAAAFQDAGRVKTYSEGLVLAGAAITTYRSTEAGERVMQKARSSLTAKRRKGLMEA